MPRLTTTALRILGAATIALTISSTDPAAAADDYPCGPEGPADWTSEPVQLCPLVAPLEGDMIPVYEQPVANPHGSQPPEPAGWLAGTTGKYFRCQLPFTNAVYYHPRGWRNFYWAHTLSDDGVEGWVPQVFFKGGDDDEPDVGLRMCDGTGRDPSSPDTTPPDNPCDASGAASEQFHLRAHFARSQSRRSVTVRYGRRLRLVGSFTRSDGTPVGATELCVASRVATSGAGRRTSGSVTTDAQGRFSYAWRARQSRRLWFVYRSGDTMATASVVVRVPAPVALRAQRPALRNGQTLVLRGRLRVPRRGAIIEIQSRRTLSAGGGRRWQTIDTVRAKRTGAFRFTWPFANTFGRQRYTFRAVVPRQPGYAFAIGRSRRVHVTVTG